MLNISLYTSVQNVNLYRDNPSYDTAKYLYLELSHTIHLEKNKKRMKK